MFHEKRRPDRINRKSMGQPVGAEIAPCFFRHGDAVMQKAGRIEYEPQRQPKVGNGCCGRLYALL